MLGLVWYREDLVRQVTSSKNTALDDSPPPEKVTYPLTLLLKPDIYQSLIKIFDLEIPGATKEGMAHVPENAIPMTTFSKDEFIKRMGMGGQRNMSSDFSDDFNKPISKPMQGLMPGPERRLGGR